MQVVVEEEEIKEKGGALEAKVSGNKDIRIIQMVVGYVVKQETTLLNVIITRKMIEGTIGHNKETMHLQQPMIVMCTYLLCIK